jgi:hypothetical protein
MQTETLTQLNLKYPELIAFFRQYEDNSDFGTDEELDIKLDWFLANRRLFLIRNQGRLLGGCAFMILNSPSQLYGKEWPYDNFFGKYLWIVHMILHPILRNKEVMKEMLSWAIEHFPKIEYIVYRKDNMTKIIKISNLINRRF